VEDICDYWYVPGDYRSDRELVRDLSDAVTRSLRLMHGEKADPSHLIFPNKRDGIPRVSEQESKVLVTQWLRGEGYTYSVETPTAKTYRQKGQTPQSALTDVTIYRRDGTGKKRRLNIELKAHQPAWQSFRKDLEKLIREDVPGLWFHTLISADQRSWDAIEKKIRKSFTDLEKREDCVAAFKDGRGSVHFWFCVLKTEEVKSFDLSFVDWDSDLCKVFPKD
jgi:hypothetical protein